MQRWARKTRMKQGQRGQRWRRGKESALEACESERKAKEGIKEGQQAGSEDNGWEGRRRRGGRRW